MRDKWGRRIEMVGRGEMVGGWLGLSKRVVVLPDLHALHASGHASEDVAVQPIACNHAIMQSAHVFVVGFVY